jgi:hypothetical protein
MEMRKITRLLVAGACAASLVAVAYAADQTILGKSFSVKAKPGDDTKTSVSTSADEKNSQNTLVGDPTLSSGGGAILSIFVNGGTPHSQDFPLPQGTSSKGKPFWSGDAAKGFKYSDSKGEQGPVKSVSVKLKKATFSIKVSVTGKNGPVSILPPDPGTSACVAIQLGTGDRYSVQFGPEPNGKITNKDGTLFKVTKPVSEGVCPGGGSTTTTTAPTTTTTSTTAATTSTTVATTTTTSTTTTTTIYGSPSRAFLTQAVDLLD